MFFINELIDRYPRLQNTKENIEKSVSCIANSYKNGGKLLVCGNGGSAADAEHIVGELMKNFRKKRKVSVNFLETYRTVNKCEAPAWLQGSLPVVSLVSFSAFMTAFNNDVNSIGAFGQQVFSLGSKGDVLLAISTSGNSKNVIEAVKIARAKGINTIGLTGSNDSLLLKYCDIAIQAPEIETYKIQEYHLPIYHAICSELEDEFFL